ncbi:MAG: ABC transporter ATP-binding protein [Phycisphaerae bacterium]|nr:MAG: ABC transporter ATP-binding protein [Phycisphaerae bacterium]
MTTRPEHPLIEVKDLSVRYGRGTAPVLRDVSFSMDRGESIALVGDSGCGKSTLALAMMQLLPSDANVRGSIVLREDARSAPIDILGADERTMQAVRGSRLAMVFQDPVGSLDPVMRIDDQLSEVIRLGRKTSRKDAGSIALELLKRVGIADPIRLARAWPHELSGGMAQRVALALALAGGPTLLIADEPTSALDGNVQAQIIELIRETRRRTGLSVLLITHDMAIARALADRVCVMDGNRIVENLPTAGLDSSKLQAATMRLVKAARFKRQSAAAVAEGGP